MICKIVGPVLLAKGEEFEAKDLVYVKTDYCTFKGTIVFVDGRYNGIVLKDQKNTSISYYIDLCQIKDIYHVCS